MTRFPASILPASVLAVCLTTLSAAPAGAATRPVRIPGQYDGAWSITAVTDQGPCAASTRYRVQIEAGDASIPGDAVDIDGGVSADGAVQATITRGTHRVPITGSLDPQGSGSGTWRTSGGLVACSGTWRAKRGN